MVVMISLLDFFFFLIIINNNSYNNNFRVVSGAWCSCTIVVTCYSRTCPILFLSLVGALVSPASLGNDHLRAQLVKLVPQSLHLQLDANVGHLGVFLHDALAVRRGAGGRRRAVRSPAVARLALALARVGARVVVVVLGGRAGLEVGLMLAVRVPGGRGEVVAPRRVEAAQAARREGCNIAKMGQLRQPRAGYGWNHPRKLLFFNFFFFFTL